MLKIGTDFSGIGAPETALKRLGIPYELIFGCEIDKYARASYNKLHPTANIIYNDITTRDFNEVPNLDLYVAGFPCQSFSVAGQRKGFDDVRGSLFYNVASFIKHNKPKVFILENVKGLLSHDSGRTYQTITDLLSNNGGTLNSQLNIDVFNDGLGYHVYTKVLNTKDYGIPQNRDRIFIVGFNYWRKFNFPKKVNLMLSIKDILEDNVDQKYYLSDKIIKGFKKHNNRHKEKGSNFIWKPKNENDLANCIRANASLCPTDNTIIEKTTKKIRRLTPLECWRLQGFNDLEFKKAQKVNSDTQLYKQAGNSITVDVLVEIFKNIYLK
jgi:DNA (cytosine-5)-methyltransferase 1|tara:strand:+ start:11016 stop:11993 length:978 start_codon:yes stop_codon:yes gene_type:complete